MDNLIHEPISASYTSDGKKWPQGMHVVAIIATVALGIGLAGFAIFCMRSESLPAPPPVVKEVIKYVEKAAPPVLKPKPPEPKPVPVDPRTSQFTSWVGCWRMP